MTTITATIVTNILAAIDAGIIAEAGTYVPGNMPVEDAIRYGFGDEEESEVSRAGGEGGRFLAMLGGSPWSSNSARAAGLRKLAIAQLGSADFDDDATKIDQAAIMSFIAEKTTKRIIPFALADLSHYHKPLRNEINEARILCVEEGTRDAAERVVQVALKAKHNAQATKDANQRATADIALECAGDAKKAFDLHRGFPSVFAATAAKALGADYALITAAKIGVEALVAAKSPGAEWLFRVL